ncbi:MAG: hypothetical protein ACREC5_05280, partial [Thermoplasmata archaeon]
LRAAASRRFEASRITTPFAHGACASLGPGRPLLWGSYHPSPLNTNTGKLTPPMLVEVLQHIRGTWETGAVRTPGAGEP